MIKITLKNGSVYILDELTIKNGDVSYKEYSIGLHMVQSIDIIHKELPSFPL